MSSLRTVFSPSTGPWRAALLPVGERSALREPGAQQDVFRWRSLRVLATTAAQWGLSAAPTSFPPAAVRRRAGPDGPAWGC
jgi:hypothetical protein